MNLLTGLIRQTSGWFVLVAAICVVLMGLGVLIGLRADRPDAADAVFKVLAEPKSVVVREIPIDGSQPAPVTVLDGAVTKALYSDIQNIPQAPNDKDRPCTLDYGPTYQLQFDNGVKASVETFGCHVVQVTRDNTLIREGTIESDDSYGQDLLAKIKETLHR